MKELTPKEIVSALDRHIVGQGQAKRSVAIALRNRWRRQQVDEQLRGEIIPNNIIMIGPTGVGKTEIARRLASLAGAPFIKVEASKFTEVGYVGRDVESIVRDLVDLGVNMVRNEHDSALEPQAAARTEERLLELLAGPVKEGEDDPQEREQLRQQLQDGLLEERIVEVETASERPPMVEVFSPMGGPEEMNLNIQEIVSGMINSSHQQRRRLPVSEARKLLVHEELHQLIDMERVVAESVERVEEAGIVFLDELDKIVGDGAKAGSDVSREGVQRDLLPIIEGCAVNTRYGPVRTDHILFIAAGAFHGTRPADLIPELQGRFPIRVELDSLDAADFERILIHPENSLIKQYTALLAAEGVALSFARDAVRQIAATAHEVNARTENIGARRLHTVMSTLLDEPLFDAPQLNGKKLRITCKYVRDRLQNILEDEDLSRYIL